MSVIKNSKMNEHNTMPHKVTLIAYRSISSPATLGRNAPPNPPIATSRLVVKSTNSDAVSFIINNPIANIPPINNPAKKIAIKLMTADDELTNINKLKNCPVQQIINSLL